MFFNGIKRQPKNMKIKPIYAYREIFPPCPINIPYMQDITIGRAFLKGYVKV